VKGEDEIEEEGRSLDLERLIERNGKRRKMIVSLWILGLHRRRKIKSKLERKKKK